MAGDLKGRLLVATPALVEPTFAGTVILVIEHSHVGAIGVVINRPSALAVAEPLPAWADLAVDPAVLFVGGPVAPSAAIGLAIGRPTGTGEGWTPLFGEVGAVDLNADPPSVGTVVSRLRIFSGYAGWGTGQLEGELAEKSWLVVDAEPGDTFSHRPESLWRGVLKRQPGRISWLANYPPDVTAN